MILKTVTITGADDKTDINEMIEISKEFPFVEWGILFSLTKTGTPRYPSHGWIKKAVLAGQQFDMNFCAHLCGKYSKDIMTDEIHGGLDDEEILGSNNHELISRFKRFQLNFNAGTLGEEMNMNNLRLLSKRRALIIQANKANKDVVKEITEYPHCGYGVHFLYDGSGGRGNLPTEWKPPVTGFYTGYAGGLTPDNLMVNLNDIRRTLNVDDVVWIDTETGVRTDDVLDMAKVRQFLKVAKTFQKLHEYES